MTGWESVCIGDICKVIAGQSPDGKFYNSEGRGLPFYQGKKDFGPRYLNQPTVWTTSVTKEAEAGDILMSVRAPVGAINVSSDRICIGRGLAAIRADARLSHKFLYYFLKYSEPMITGTEGAVFASINKKQIEAIKLPLPSLPDQVRIVGILDQAFEGLAKAKANAERNLANAKELFDGFLTNVFSQTHADGVMRKMSEVCERITVGHVGSMASRYIENGIPFLRSQNIRPFEIDLNNVVFIDDVFHASLKKSRLKGGDVAIVRTGYPGTAAVIPDDIGEANCSDIVLMTPNQLADPYYLTAFFNSSYGKSTVSGESVGAAQKHFNVTSAKNVVLSFPPIEKQRHLCAEIKAFKEKVETASDVYERKADAIDRLKASILHQAFSGNL